MCKSNINEGPYTFLVCLIRVFVIVPVSIFFHIRRISKRRRPVSQALLLTMIVSLSSISPFRQAMKTTKPTIHCANLLHAKCFVAWTV